MPHSISCACFFSLRISYRLTSPIVTSPSLRGRGAIVRAVKLGMPVEKGWVSETRTPGVAPSVRTGFFRGRGDRSAVQTVEEENLAHLSSLDQRRNDLAVGCAIVEQRGPDRQVYIPYVAVAELPDPAQLTRSDFERND